jgi:type II secretory pathway pseudopilin PulG
MKTIELLVVIAIIGILASLILPPTIRAAKRIQYQLAVIRAFHDQRINNALHAEERQNYNADAGFAGPFDFRYHLKNP